MQALWNHTGRQGREIDGREYTSAVRSVSQYSQSVQSVSAVSRCRRRHVAFFISGFCCLLPMSPYEIDHTVLRKEIRPAENTSTIDWRLSAGERINTIGMPSVRKEPRKQPPLPELAPVSTGRRFITVHHRACREARQAGLQATISVCA